jgi:hypothetical protein
MLACDILFTLALVLLDDFRHSTGLYFQSTLNPLNYTKPIPYLSNDRQERLPRWS